MRKYIKRAVSLLFAVLLLASMFPYAVFADPISAVAIANGFAQAITAYGASNGVSLIFDGVNSNNTAQIGENIHELWKRFRESQQTADDYETIAQAVFPSLYSKTVTNLGRACVAISIADTYMPDVDQFWNWLLSGPAQMTKVDNQYFEWRNDQQTGLVITPNVLENYTFGGFSCIKLPVTWRANRSPYNTYTRSSATSAEIYVFSCKGTGTTATTKANEYISIVPASVTFETLKTNGDLTTSTNVLTEANNGLWYRFADSVAFTDQIPHHNYTWDYIANKAEEFANPLGYDGIKVQPYVGDAIPQDVYIPDTSDPDYGPLPYFGPLDIPWNDTLFGDGTGVLDGAQSEAVADAVDDVIASSGTKTIGLAQERVINPDRPDEDDPISDNPYDYAVLGLDDVFPFCIPFDIYRFLSALAAEPVAPHFTATLAFPEAVGGTQTIEIDFDNPTFNQLAQLLRLLELLAFIVGLALLTRSMFIRG